MSHTVRIKLTETQKTDISALAEMEDFSYLYFPEAALARLGDFGLLVYGSGMIPTETGSGTGTETETETETVTGTETPTETPTGTGEATPTGSDTETPTGSGTETPTGTGTETPTGTGEATPTGSDTETPTGTGEATPTGTGEATPTGTGEATPTGTGEATPTGTETPTGTGTETPTGTPTGTETPTPSGTPEPGTCPTDDCLSCGTYTVDLAGLTSCNYGPLGAGKATTLTQQTGGGFPFHKICQWASSMVSDGDMRAILLGGLQCADGRWRFRLSFYGNIQAISGWADYVMTATGNGTCPDGTYTKIDSFCSEGSDGFPATIEVV